MDVDAIKKLREETKAGVLDIKQALENADGDVEKAMEELVEKGKAKAAKKKAERTVGAGLVHSYIHGNGAVGSLILLACETDFVAKTDDFQNLAHEIAMQVATGDYADVSDLLDDDYIRDPSKKISDLINETIAVTGEKIELINFSKLSVRELE